MEPRHDRGLDAAVEAYRQMWTALRQTAEPQWAQLELTISQLKGLLLLEVRGSLTISQVADILEIGKPSASMLIEQLVQLGLVERTEDPADRRRSIVCLTERGTGLAERLHQGDEAQMRSWFERMSSEDLSALDRGMRALADVIVPTPTMQESGSA